MKNTDKLIYLYRCFDKYGNLLYVGITDNPEVRMRAHAAEKFWWSDVARTTHMPFKSREQALWAEWAVITTCHPMHNRQTAPPLEHRCPTPPKQPKHQCPEPPMAIDGHIYMLQKLAEIEKNADKYRAMDEELAEKHPKQFGYLVHKAGAGHTKPID